MDIKFADSCPPRCTRQCRRIHEYHNKAISVALYSPPVKDMTLTHKICVYGFSCGEEIYSHVMVEPTEKLSETLARAVFDLLPKLTNMAQKEKDDLQRGKVN